MDKTFLDFKCNKCGIEFWQHINKKDTKEVINRTCNEKCPNCGNKGTIERIQTPDRYRV